jgi:hypothetical protein
VRSDELARARQRAQKLYPRSKGFENTYVRGARAALDGKTSAECPYPNDPSKTWRKAYRLAWMRGHQSCRVIGEEG